MAPSTGGDGAAAGDDSAAAAATGGDPPTEPSEVAVAIDEYGDALAGSIESALAGRSGVVAVGVPLGLLPSVLAARSRTADGEPWRVACRPGAVDALERAFVLGTAVAESVTEGSIELRTLTGEAVSAGDASAAETAPRSLVFATPDRVDAVAGPRADRTLVSETGDATAAARGAASARFEAAAPAPVGMPSRTRLLAAARGVLDDRFADDVAAVLDALDYGAVGRVGTVTDRALFVALAARHDHLFRDLRRWIDGEWSTGDESGSAGNEPGSAGIGADGVGPDGGRVAIAPGQELTDDRRALVERKLIESIKMPMGPGRPQFRLRAVDEALLRAEPTEVLSVLRGRFALPLDEDGTLYRGPGEESRRPVWDRRR
ncbi:hypothetical protein DJ82_10000 [Halorubrum sp. Ib24]|uniref:transcriptional regulator TbsP domain-containing protein n=1 Tax=unclassified Halorubrum TaxID=2642239 RepID=UPI000B988F77|nr:MULTISPECIES: DUF5821 family protein [unclassified Halorubrum]OYR39267.1 hypothetical protein DJ82_10000 [Halorubrum sp. Ib24]OYR48967.1 hypothetical protein DJ75_01835 [Halorubrum sp. Eb13]OYR50705.1 hypothetical protein DJ73_15545 [Halorubrum sp. Ea1]